MADQIAKDWKISIHNDLPEEHPSLLQCQVALTQLHEYKELYPDDTDNELNVLYDAAIAGITRIIESPLGFLYWRKAKTILNDLRNVDSANSADYEGLLVLVEQKKEQTPTGKIIGGAAGVVLLCLLLGVVVSAIFKEKPPVTPTPTNEPTQEETLDATSESTSAPSDTPSPTNTSPPTNTPRPGETAVPPSDTPLPTETKIPTKSGTFLPTDTPIPDITVTASAAFSATAWYNPGVCDTGDYTWSATIVAQASGGAPPYTFSFNGAGGSPNGANGAIWTLNGDGVAGIIVKVFISDSASNSTSVNLLVPSPCPEP